MIGPFPSFTILLLALVSWLFLDLMFEVMPSFWDWLTLSSRFSSKTFRITWSYFIQTRPRDVRSFFLIDIAAELSIWSRQKLCHVHKDLGAALGHYNIAQVAQHSRNLVPREAKHISVYTQLKETERESQLLGRFLCSFMRIDWIGPTSIADFG